jgi:hypothetical protein
MIHGQQNIKHLPSLLDGAVLSGVGLGTDRGEEPRGGAESKEPL